MQQSDGNVCAKFQVDRLRRSRTGVPQVFNTQTPFLSEIRLNMKTATSNPF